MSTALVGKTLERIVIFNGQGRNGKSLLDELMARALGCDKAMLISYPAAVLIEKRSGGPCPEIANMNKKTFVMLAIQ